MRTASGDVYEGYWLNGLYSGKGRLAYANGDVYVGQMTEGKRHGPGMIKYRDGSQERGTWRDDVKVTKLGQSVTDANDKNDS